MAHPQIIAHRGASGHAPENTLAAYRLAIELGSQSIEADVQSSSDGHIVAFHDAVLQRTTNGRGSVAESTFEELRAVDAGRWFDRDFAGQRIPMIEEVLGLSREAEIGFYFQLRCPFSDEFGRLLIQEVGKADALTRVVIVSSEPTALGALRQLDHAIVTGLRIDSPHPDAVEQAAGAGARQLYLREDLVTAEVVNRVHGAGLLAVAGSVNPPTRMRALLAARVDGIVTGFPDRLRAIIEDSDEAGRETGRMTQPH